MAARAKMASAAGAGAGTSNSQTTSLTPNSNCVASGSGDPNNSTTVQFYAPPNGIAWWTTAVSTATPRAQLGADIGNAVVTFKAGLTVQYVPLSGGGYNVILSGNIIDGSTSYTFAGSVIYQSTGTASAPVSTKGA